MLLPNNGKVVVIDDKIEDVQELLAGLSSEGVSFLYYRDEALTDLPSQPISNVRLVILDLLLINDREPPAKEVVASIAVRLKRILSPSNGPYVLLYWSTMKKEYAAAFEEALEQEQLRKFKPMIMLDLPKPATLAIVKEALKSRFEDFKALNPLLAFESAVNEAGGDLVSALCRVAPIDANWNQQLITLLEKSAMARLGVKGYTEHDDQGRLQNALMALASTVEERTVQKIESQNLQEAKIALSNSPTQNPRIVGEVNALLHLSDRAHLGRATGNLFLLNGHTDKLLALWQALAGPQTTVVPSGCTIVLVDITPSCDYNQDKDYSRFIGGLLVPEEHIEHVKKSKPAYINSLPLVRKGELSFRLYLDSRFLLSSSSVMPLEFETKFHCRLNQSIVADILTKVSGHVSRPGYMFLE
jgi:hypothetical protein